MTRIREEEDCCRDPQSDTVIYGHINHSYLLTYLLTQTYIWSTTADDTFAQRSVRGACDPDALFPRRSSLTWSWGWGRLWLVTGEEVARQHWPTLRPCCDASWHSAALLLAAAAPRCCQPAQIFHRSAWMLSLHRTWSRALSLKCLYPKHDISNGKFTLSESQLTKMEHEGKLAMCGFTLKERKKNAGLTVGSGTSQFGD